MKKYLLLSLLFLSFPSFATTYYAADESFTPAGNDSNNGLSAATPRTDEWCNDNLSPGDVCIYANGNYGNDDIVPTVSGTSINPILYTCATKHGCIFDRIVINNMDYIEIRRVKTDTFVNDPTKSTTNPRIKIDNSSYITLTSVYIIGNLTTDQGFMDLIDVQSTSNHIEIRSHDTYGETRLINTAHTQLILRDNATTGAICAANEINFWIHGTVSTPLIMSSENHHAIGNKGVCKVLVEHVDFQRHGTGDGDLLMAGGEPTTGGTHHGATNKYYIARFNTYSFCGSGTSSQDNDACIEVGNFAAGFTGSTTEVQNNCYAHLSAYRPYGNFAGVSRLNTVTNVQDITFLNIAIDDGSYYYVMDQVDADKTAIGYAFERGANSPVSNIYLDGIVYNPVPGLAGDKFVYKRYAVDATYASTDCPAAELGDSSFQCGSNISYDTDQLFVDPDNRDFRINDTAALSGTASPIANVSTTATSTNTVEVNRSYCFMDDMGGLRPSGDIIDINGDECTISAVDIDSNPQTITCNETINVTVGDNIFYKINGTVMDDIGAILSGEPDPDPGLPTPGPPRQLGNVVYDNP